MLLEIQATTAKISPEEVLASLPESVKAKVRGKNAAVYCIGEEGISRPRVVGSGNAVLRWPRAVIRRLAEAAKAGTKLFERHGKDNSHDGRKPLGEIVGSFTRVVGDKLQAIAVAVMPEERPDLDVCSIEADVDTRGDIVGDVASVTGLALSSSKVDSPAFAGAQRLATLQCFEPDNDPDENKQTGKPGEGEPKMAVTFQDVRDFVKERNVFPNQLFTKEDLKNDREFAPMLAEGEAAKEKVVTLTAELEEVKKRAAAHERASQNAVAKEEFVKLIPEGATEKQKAFYLKRFDPSKLEKVDNESLKAYLEAEAKEYAEHAKLFGVEDTGHIETNSASGGDASGENPVDAALKETIGG